MCPGPAEIIERKVAPDGSVNYYVHYMDCKSPLSSCSFNTESALILRSTCWSTEKSHDNIRYACAIWILCTVHLHHDAVLQLTKGLMSGSARTGLYS